ncbi:hypothetical protein H8S10_07685 [Clostridium sp. NSJ-49]|uniref:Uncharacterized protein n=1 Tax=Clostridium disporicum TaxID=84024 RepID=A0A174C4S3_9CLOT|nr:MULTISPECIES: hypothetical protein [Clostridium]MBC5625331.1 hypothetical protein [Clostridium sp. NSJ-49]MCD2501442.1 hypothetical protein [Clostridium sp. NSJ-145]CUO06885.1 Uncharacterised protein [Clostridium disporicum]
MSLEVVGCYRELSSIKEECKTYLSYHAVLIMSDGSTCDGIIEGVDDDSDEIIVLVGEDVVIDDGDNMSRQQPMGYKGPNRYRRFRRRKFPINRINRLDLLRYPFIYPVYPYPYPYPFFPY